MKRYLVYLLSGGLIIAVIATAILLLTPSRATAQGLVEYALICLDDLGAPPDPALVDMSQLEEAFGIPLGMWPEDNGVFISCTPKFDRTTNVFNKLRICGARYQDVNLNGHLDFGDIKLDEVCTTIKQ